ncbi:glycosyltransferase family 2 protein [Stomatohabitans albus]|uniref:glycosyltransferase family 2 protein n=1 Tax=Stomatohabitans albus TaxID=3110766 RepID=UPI00300D2174
MTTGVVVVSHNTRDDALACLASLQHAGADQVVLVDSGSSDGTARAVKAAFPEISVLAGPNVGFGKACNRGVQELDTDYVVVANADVRFDPNSAGALGAFLDANPTVGIVGPAITHPDGRPQASARTFPDLGTAVGHAALSLVWPDNPFTRRYRMAGWDKTSQRDVDWVSGACLAIRRQVWDQLGGFDPAYFMFVEDVDLSWRAHKHGWRVVFSPVAHVTHSVGSSVAGRKATMVRAHVRSLDYFITNRYAYPLPIRVAMRAGMTIWAVSVVSWGALSSRTHGQLG